MAGARRSQSVKHDGRSLCLSLEDGRVAPGGYPPRAPTDPDVRDSRIRLLGLRFRCAAIDGVDDAWGRQGVVAQQSLEMLPSHLGRMRASV